jgi:predicted lysophospholipase L1 biosynthesis ABC-type transport system permease subunit
MKTAQLPPVRVEPTVREEIESVLLEGESLSQFVETATVQAARRRKAQQAFLERGRASLANAKATGEFYPLHGVLDQMRARLDARMDEQRRARRVKSKKP